jgi:glycosyltransferase involved in cell wall biosynthesis
VAAMRLDRRRCRQRFEQRFTAERMARDYVDVYRRVAAHRAPVEFAASDREVSHG